MSSSRALKAVAAIERRLRAEARAAAALACGVATVRRRHHDAFARDCRRFQLPATRSAFSCAVAGARRRLHAAVDDALSREQAAAEASARAAAAATLPWAQIRRGLERRAARLPKPPAA